MLTDEFDGHDRVIDLVGATSIGGLMHVISSSGLVVANDSAALHMAVGYDKPIIALFGPTETGKVGPFRRDESVLQHAADLRGVSHKQDEAGLELMRRISVEQVLERLRSILGAPAAPEEAAR